MKKILFTYFSFLLFVSISQGQNGIITVKSSHNVQATTDSLVRVLNSKGMTVFARIDHAKGAKSVGKELRPTQLVIFGNPKIGTVLMQCNQEVGIDLPQKMLIWQDAKDQTWISYNNPDYLVNRHHLKECNGKIIANIKSALKKFAEAAAK
ncbi:camphor resistance protein CrcB [bacterium BMS3Abin04]|nr:camphor resistance protein CrcB [bacterium BMS3Abin04]